MRTLRFAALLVLASCTTRLDPQPDPGAWTHDGKPVRVWTLRGRGGLVGRFTNYGAILQSLHVPDRNGRTADVVLGFDDVTRYFKPHPFFGATAGRVANRIANAEFAIDGKTYTLAKNNGPHSLHGGNRGFDKHAWDVDTGESADGPWIQFSRVSPDGEEGFPGTVLATVTYQVTHENELKVMMTATTDQPTLVNLAHHTYWNLAGQGDVLGHELTLFCDRYTPGDATVVPKGTIEPVAGTPFDFRTSKPIGRDLAAAGGYDTNFVVNGKEGELRPVAKVVEPTSGRTMELFATEPGVQFYTGFGGMPDGRGGAAYPKHAGFCLETQKYPDAVHHPDWPSPILRPGQTYRHQMVHRFTAR